MTTTLDEDMANESWGVRQFYLWVAKCADNCEECTGAQPNECTVCTAPYQMKDGSCQLVGDWQVLHKGFSTNEFTDNDGWGVTGVAGDVITDCGGTKLFGGFEKFEAVRIYIFNLGRVFLHLDHSQTSPTTRESRFRWSCGRSTLGMARR